MFTGIVREMGEIVGKEQSAAGATLKISCRKIFSRLKLGDSVSVDGVCLTVSEKGSGILQLEATPETLRCSNLGTRKAGDRVNLEPATKWSDLLGGHLMQGHVDGVGTVVEIRPEGNSHILRFQAPPDLLRYCALKGSIGINGVSLTISGLNSDSFEVAIIPHTMEITNVSLLKVEDQVNLEVDMISKYVEIHVRRLLGIVAAIFLSSHLLMGDGLTLRPNMVLVYENEIKETRSQFVVRLARYRPDVFLEWESKSFQGTLHLYREAVEDARKFSFARLFENGVDMESSDVMTIWLSERMYEDLIRDGRAKIKSNQLWLKMRLEGEGTFRLTVDQEVREISVVRVRDDREQHWSFHKDPRNPILVEYVSPYLRRYLKTASTGSTNNLRWIKQLPPVK